MKLMRNRECQLKVIAHNYKCLDVFHLLLEKPSFYQLVCLFPEHEWFHNSPLNLLGTQPPFKGRQVFFLVIHHLPYLGTVEFCSLFRPLVMRAIGHRSSWLMWGPFGLAPVPETGEKLIRFYVWKTMCSGLFYNFRRACLLKGLWLGRLNWIYFISRGSSSFSLWMMYLKFPFSCHIAGIQDSHLMFFWKFLLLWATTTR